MPSKKRKKKRIKITIAGLIFLRDKCMTGVSVSILASYRPRQRVEAVYVIQTSTTCLDNVLR
jgi:hypothetical protein